MTSLLKRAFHPVQGIKRNLLKIVGQNVEWSNHHRRAVCLSASLRATAQLVDDEPASKKKSLVIFDKDGTLICLHSMYGPWRDRIVNNLETSSGLKLAADFDERFGYCSKTEKLRPGLLAEGTHEMLKEGCRQLLVDKGISEEDVHEIVESSWDSEHGECEHELKTLGDLIGLFKTLRQNDVKIAICTSDSREVTMKSIQKLGLEPYVDKIVCGDDATSMPKPSPHNALMICDALKVHPSEAVVVGDSLSDMHMGKDANLGASIAVSTGCGSSDYLEPHSDFVVDRLSDLLPLVIPDHGTSLIGKTKASLVIFDSHGTLLDFNHTWSPFVKDVAQKLNEASSMDLREDIYKILGYDSTTDRMCDGVLAYGTEMEAMDKVSNLLRKKGIKRYDAKQMVNTAWNEVTRPWKSLDDIGILFQTLQHYGIKIAICTSDSREWMVRALDHLHVSQYVDAIICGDDLESQPKPSPYNVERICEELDVDESNTVLVGDTVADVGMGRLAHVGKVIGVLSGLGTKDDLQRHADLVLPSVNDVLPVILPDCHKDFISGLKTQRPCYSHYLLGQMMKPASLSPMQRHYSTSSSSNATYDYVIVGAGSAGCVLANRLSADTNNTVLSLEAGPKDNTWTIDMPAALMYNLADDKYNWYYKTVPQKHVNNRVMYWPRGRVWGGSSSLNAMVYIRGHAFDYDRWERQGAAGWSYADCLPYFRRSQTHELGADDYRGGEGPLYVSRGITNNPLHDAYIEAGQQAGYAYTDDMNGYQQEGFGRMDMTIKKGRRWNTAKAYLRPVLDRKNLSTEVRAFTTRILFDGNRAVGVEYEQGGTLKQVRANKEVILSGGAINSPQLLMLSGVGNADHLKKLDIPVVAHLPGVGENLQEHLDLYIQNACTQPITLYKAQWKFPHNMIKIGLQWFLTKTGDGATTHLESGSFIRTTDDYDHPDIQYHFLPSVVIDHGQKMGHCHAYQAHASPMRPLSAGTLKLASRDPRDHPIIDPNYLACEEDVINIRDSVKRARDIFAQKAFDPFRGEEIWPGKHIQSDADLDAVIREKTDSAYHPSCTCKMGAETDPMAVVDSQTRVIGIEGLRVVDASIMPSVVSGNLNGPTVMVAEKAADIILGKAPLARSTAPVWMADDVRQRLGVSC